MCLVQKDLKYGAFYLGQIVEQIWRTRRYDQFDQKQVLVKGTGRGMTDILGSKKSVILGPFSREDSPAHLEDLEVGATVTSSTKKRISGKLQVGA